LQDTADTENTISKPYRTANHGNTSQCS